MNAIFVLLKKKRTKEKERKRRESEIGSRIPKKNEGRGLRVVGR